MKRIILGLAPLVVALPALGQAPQPAKFTVAGIPVIQKPVTANDVVAVRLYLKGGSAALTPGTAGIERFIGAISTRGTAKYSKDDFANLSTSTGTNIGMEIEYDYAVMTAQAVTQHWNEAWDLLTEAVLRPSFAAEDVDQVRGQIVDELKQRRDNPDEHLRMLADSLLYTGHVYELDPLGTPETISRLTRDDLMQWHKRRLTKANLLVVVVGNVSRADLTRKITAAFGSLPDTGGEPGLTPPLRPMTPDVATVKQDLPTNYVLGVYAAPAPVSPDFAAVRVATRVLGERLFEEVRTKRNMTYAVSAQLGTFAVNRGSLYVTAVQPDTTIKVIFTEVRKLQLEMVPAARLGQSVNVYVTQLLMGQQTNMGQAADLGLWELVGGGYANAQSYVGRLRSVTPQDVQRVAQTYFKNARFAVLGDPTKVDAKLFKSM